MNPHPPDGKPALSWAIGKPALNSVEPAVFTNAFIKHIMLRNNEYTILFRSNVDCETRYSNFCRFVRTIRRALGQSHEATSGQSDEDFRMLCPAAAGVQESLSHALGAGAVVKFATSNPNSNEKEKEFDAHTIRFCSTQRVPLNCIV